MGRNTTGSQQSDARSSWPYRDHIVLPGMAYVRNKGDADIRDRIVTFPVMLAAPQALGEEGFPRFVLLDVDQGSALPRNYWK